MLNRIHARFASLALFVAAAAFVLSACDSGNGTSPGSVNTGVEDTLQIAQSESDLGADYDTRTPTITIVFTQSIVENEYTTDEIDQQDSEANDGSSNRHLIDGIRLTTDQAKNTTTTSNSIPVEIEWKEDRTRLDVTPTENLQDGFIYNLSLGDDNTNTGVYDTRFKSQSGDPFNNVVTNPVYDAEALSFSVGIDEAQPATPTVVFNEESAAVANDNTLEDEVFDYTDSGVTAPLEVPSIDNSGAEVKGYEVYVRTQDTRTGRSGIPDTTFTKVTNVSPQANPNTFEDSDGIVPASAVQDSEFDDGQLEFTATVGNTPFEGSDGTYGPIDWKFRAVSINGVRSDFTNVVTTGDNTDLDVVDANITDTDGGDIEEITVTFDEPTQTGTVDSGNFSFQQSDGTSLNVGVSVVDDGGGDQDGTEVELDITENGSNTDDLAPGDEIVVSSITDLAGNGLDNDVEEIN